MSRINNSPPIFQKKMVKENFDDTLSTKVIWMMIYQLQKEASIYGITNLLIQFLI